MNASKFITICVILFSITWAIYANTCNNKFAFDDKGLIVNNSLLHSDTSLKEIFTTNYRYGVGFTEEGLYRPLVVLSYVINNSDLDPMPFHLFNITVNAFNTILLFVLIYFLFNHISLAVITALLFAFHPIHTEAVANISGRPELLCTFFLLLAWIFLEKSFKRFWLLSIGTLFFLASLLSKETAAVFPFIIVLSDYVLGKPLKHKKTLSKYAAIALTLLVYLFIRYSILGDSVTGLDPVYVDNPIADFNVLERIATASVVFLLYLKQLVVPITFYADYSYNQIPLYHNLLHPIPLTAITFFLSFVVSAIFLNKKYPVYTISVVTFLFPYILISNILFPVGTIMGERLMYLPSVGFALFIAAILARLYHSWKREITFLILIILTMYSIRTITRNRDWYDDYSLFSADITNGSNSVKALCNMGYLERSKRGYSESEKYYKAALAIYPEYDVALRGMGKLLYDQKQYPESASYYKKTVLAAPHEYVSYYDYGIVLNKLGNFNESEKALKEALHLAPENPSIVMAYGNLMVSMDNVTAAVEYLELAMRLGGDKRIILNNLATTCFLSGNIQKAYEYSLMAKKIGVAIHPELVQSIQEHIDGN